MSDSHDITFGYDPIRGGFSFRISGRESGETLNTPVAGGLAILEHADGKFHKIGSFWGNGGVPLFGLTDRQNGNFRDAVTLPIVDGVATLDTIRLQVTDDRVVLALAPDTRVGERETVQVGDAAVHVWFSPEKILGGRPVPNEPTRERVPCRQLTRIEIPQTLLSPNAPLRHLFVETVDYHN